MELILIWTYLNWANVIELPQKIVTNRRGDFTYAPFQNIFAPFSGRLASETQHHPLKWRVVLVVKDSQKYLVVVALPMAAGLHMLDSSH